MTFRTSINSRGTAQDALKRGFKSMFSNYGNQTKTVPPVDTDKKDHAGTR